MDNVEDPEESQRKLAEITEKQSKRVFVCTLLQQRIDTVQRYFNYDESDDFMTRGLSLASKAHASLERVVETELECACELKKESSSSTAANATIKKATKETDADSRKSPTKSTPTATVGGEKQHVNGQSSGDKNSFDSKVSEVVRLYTQAILDCSFSLETRLVDADFASPNADAEMHEVLSWLQKPLDVSRKLFSQSSNVATAVLSTTADVDSTAAVNESREASDTQAIEADSEVKSTGVSDVQHDVKFQKFLLRLFGSELLECLHWRRGALLFMYLKTKLAPILEPTLFTSESEVHQNKSLAQDVVKDEEKPVTESGETTEPQLSSKTSCLSEQEIVTYLGRIEDAISYLVDLRLVRNSWCSTTRTSTSDGDVDGDAEEQGEVEYVCHDHLVKELVRHGVYSDSHMLALVYLGELCTWCTALKLKRTDVNGREFNGTNSNSNILKPPSSTDEEVQPQPVAAALVEPKSEIVSNDSQQNGAADVDGVQPAALLTAHTNADVGTNSAVVAQANENGMARFNVFRPTRSSTHLTALREYARLGASQLALYVYLAGQFPAQCWSVDSALRYKRQLELVSDCPSS